MKDNNTFHRSLSSKNKQFTNTTTNMYTQPNANMTEIKSILTTVLKRRH